MTSNGIEVSTNDLVEVTERRLGRFSLEDLYVVWHAIGISVAEQLQQHKAVRLTSLGTFSFPLTGGSSAPPVFVLTPEFASLNKLRQPGGPPPTANIPTAALNFTQVRAVCQRLLTQAGRSDAAASKGTGAFSREILETIYNEMLSGVGRSLSEGRAVTLSIYKVGELLFRNGQVIFTLRGDFMTSLSNNNSSFVAKASRTVTGRDLKTIAQRTVGRTLGATGTRRTAWDDLSTQMTGLNVGGRMAPTATQRPAARTTNGTGHQTGMASPRPASAGRMQRPSSASSVASRGSVTPRASTPRGGSNARGAQSISTQGLQRGTGVASCLGGDARSIAARAIAGAGGSDIISRVRTKIAERGGSNGLRSVARLLAIMDDDGDRKLSQDELRYGLRDYGLDISNAELAQVFAYLDRDGNGFIDYDELLIGLRGELQPQRAKLVKDIFQRLDFDGSGVIDVNEILQVYDLNWHPDVREGKKTTKEAARDMMSVWDRHDRNGEVTMEEFLDYYSELSASIDDESYFELMIRNAWRGILGEQTAVKPATRFDVGGRESGGRGAAGVRPQSPANPAVRRVNNSNASAGVSDIFGGGNNSSQRPSSTQAPPARSTPRSATPTSRNPITAWGDESSAPPARRAIGGSTSTGVDDAAIRTLGTMLYNPPISLEKLCSRLQVSNVNSRPRMARAAFAKRLTTLNPSLTATNINAILTSVDTRRTGEVDIEGLHKLLSSYFGKDRESNKDRSVIDRAIAKIFERCGENAGIRGLSRCLAIMDDNGDKRLTRDELKTGLMDYGVELNLRELDELFSHFDRDKNGTIDFDEFLVGLRGDLNERRKALVRLAFDILDTDGSGVVTTDELVDRYDCNSHPDVQSGRRSAKDVMREFIRVWDCHDGDGQITWDEFLDYYREVSASIDGDDYFELMIRNAWRIAGGKGVCENTANRRMLVTHADGRQTVETLQNELGLRANDRDEMARRLRAQGIQPSNFETHGSYDNVRNAKAGAARPTGAGNGRQRGNTHTAPSNSHPPLAVQHAAAEKLAAAYRGRLGRKTAETERRKADYIAQERYEAELEENRPRPRQILRPKGKSYIGF